MELIGLTGGIGSGKSTVSGFLRELGATVIDADEAARAVVEPGTPGFDQLVGAFGQEFVREDGRIDRDRLAKLVFRDAAARQRLNGIVHPLVRDWMAERQAEAAARGAERVVLDIPLLYENGLDAAMKAVIVVHVPPQVQISRLVEQRGFDEEQARARVAAQMPIDDKASRTAHVVDNSGTREKTREQVERVWRELSGQGSSS